MTTTHLIMFFFGGASSEEHNISPPTLTLRTIVEPLGKVPDGDLVRIAMTPWRDLVAAIRRDRSVLFSLDWRKLEELVAASYEAAGFDEVILTPRSGDGGRDVIAQKHGLCSVRVFDQVKAYSPNRLVTADDVRAMLGVLLMYPNTSKGFITTTANFAPTIAADAHIQQFVPNRLQLRNGDQLVAHLNEVGDFQPK